MGVQMVMTVTASSTTRSIPSVFAPPPQIKALIK